MNTKLSRIVVRPFGALSLLALVACQTAAPAPTAAPVPPATQAPAAPAATAIPTSAPSAAPAATVAAVPTTAPETIKLGISQPLTGPAARNGLSSERFARLGIDDVNAKGGFKVGSKTYVFDATTVDDKCSADAGREAANKLVLSEKVKFIIAGCAGAVAAAQAVTEPANVLMISMSAPDTALGKDHPTTLIVQAHNMMRVGAMYEWLTKEHPAAKKVMVVASDDATGRSNAKYAQNEAKQRNLNIVAEEFYPLDLKDVGPLATRIVRQNPDAIDFGTTAGRSAVFVPLAKTIYEQGYRGIRFATSADTAAQKEAASVLEGFTTALLADYNATVVAPGEKDVVLRYIKKYGEAEMEISSMSAFNIPLIFAQGMAKASTADDGAKVAQAIRDMELDTDFGKSRFVGAKTFGLAAALEQPIYLNKVQGGSIVTFTSVKGTLP